MSAKPINFLTYCKRKFVFTIEGEETLGGRDEKSTLALLNRFRDERTEKQYTSFVLRFCHFSDQKFSKNVLPACWCFQHFMLWCYLWEVIRLFFPSVTTFFFLFAGVWVLVLRENYYYGKFDNSIIVRCFSTVSCAGASWSVFYCFSLTAAISCLDIVHFFLVFGKCSGNPGAWSFLIHRNISRRHILSCSMLWRSPNHKNKIEFDIFQEPFA